MSKLTRSLCGTIIAIASIGSNARSVMANAHPGQIQQPAVNRQAQLVSQAPTHDWSSSGQPIPEIDRPPGFGSLNHDPSSVRSGSWSSDVPNCPAGTEGDRCSSPVTAKEDREPKSATVLKDSPPVDLQNGKPSKNPYQIRWGNSSQFTK